MTGVNKVILIGNLGAKPEMKYTPTGVPKTTFSIATTERWGTDEQGNQREHTEWHRIVAWRKLGEICNQYLDKGSKIYIEGRLRTRSWQGQDGVTRYTTEIQLDNMLMLGSKGQREVVPDAPEYEAPEFSSSKGSFPGNAADTDEIKQIDLDDDLDDNFL